MKRPQESGSLLLLHQVILHDGANKTFVSTVTLTRLSQGDLPACGHCQILPWCYPPVWCYTVQCGFTLQSNLVWHGNTGWKSLCRWVDSAPATKNILDETPIHADRHFCFSAQEALVSGLFSAHLRPSPLLPL